MKTTIEIPDELFRRTKATAALAGETLKEFVATAIQERLDRQTDTLPPSRGWRSVFGHASHEEVAEINSIVAEEFGRIDPEDWR